MRNNEHSTQHLDAVTQAIRQTADRAQHIEQAANRLVSADHEGAASIEETRVAVEGTFRQVVEKLSGTGTETQQGATRTWISAGGV